MDGIRHDDRFIVNLKYGDQSLMVFLFPVFAKGSEKPGGFLAASPAKSFLKQFQYAGEQIYLVDNRGTHSFLLGGAAEIPDGAFMEGELVFNGWRLVLLSQEDAVMTAFASKIPAFYALGAIILLAAVAVSYLIAKRITKPIADANAAVEGIAAEVGAAKSAYRVSARRRRLHFKARLILLYMAIALPQIVVFSMGFYHLAQDIYDVELGYMYEHRLNFLFDQIEMIVMRYKRTANELIIDADIQRYLASPDTYGGIAYRNAIFAAQAKSPELIDISLYGASSARLFSSLMSDRYYPADYQAGLVEAISRDPYTPVWTNADRSEFDRSRFYVAYGCFGTAPVLKTGMCLGYIVLEFDISEIEQIVRDFSQHGGAEVYLFDESGASVLPARAARRDDILANGVFRADAPIEGRGNLLFEAPMANHRWRVLAEIPRQEFLQERDILLKTCLGIIAILLLVCVGFAYFSSVAISRSLDAFVSFLRRPDVLRARFRRSSADEVEELALSFNDLLDKLDGMVAREAENQIAIKNIQLAAKQFELNLLQSQINPHFLYNTLKTVQYMVHVGDPRAERMVKLLIQLFRSGVSREEKLVPVRDELAHVSAYYEIQQIRFSDKFEIVYDIQEGAELMPVLKLTLQPIVENAIYHGLELLGRNGTIRISAAVVGQCLEIAVEDDGLGISPDLLEQIRKRLRDGDGFGNGGAADSRGIGIANVHERIRLYFGAEYGLSIDSAVNEGTCVVLRFPCRRAGASSKPAD
jgi:sensor histidine kinase YesM